MPPRNLLALLAIIFILFSCSKSASNPYAADCEAIQQSKITGAKTSYFVGETIYLSTTKITNAQYSWDHSNYPGTISLFEDIKIESCQKQDEGWFYLTVSNEDCTTKYDSVYIKVTNKPEVAPCTPVKNQVTFSALPNISASSAVLSIDPTYNFKKIRIAQSIGYPTMEILFPQYWNDKEFEDGAYITQSIPSFGSDIYAARLSVIDQSVFYVAHPGKIYLSHESGKLRLVFCNLTMTGTLGGPTFTTTASADFTLK